jgi:hypothetical protein
MAKRKKSRKSKPPKTQQRMVSRERLSIKDEANYIISRARNREARLVTLGSLVFFSTETGDAWVLDPEDGLALRLARDGDEQPFTIIETPTNFGVEWNASYQIDGEAFIVAERSGRIKTIFGYPTREISLAVRRVG